MRHLVFAGAVALAFAVPAMAFEPSPAVLRVHEASLGMPDSTGYPMDGCCAPHEEVDGYFLGYPPELWWDISISLQWGVLVSLQLPECQGDTRCEELYIAQLKREQSLSEAVQEYLVTWYTTDTFERDTPIDMTAALERATTFSHDPL